MKLLRVGILGASSYTGKELIQLLLRHKGTEIVFLSSQTNAGQKIADLFGELYGVCDQLLLSPAQCQEQAREVDCIFSCLPHAVSADLSLPFIEAGVRIIDLSADFRITDPELYKKWYDHDHPRPELLKKAVFGLPEYYREQIRTTQILANPGCYPTSILLPLLPLFATPGVEIGSIIADSKSGVSGAGRALKLTSHYVEANESFSAYSVGRSHRHIAEIEQELSKIAGRAIEMTFSPHLLPVNRGILSTIYIGINKSAEECSEIVAARYRTEPFVRIRSKKDLPRLSNVTHTNFCDIAFTGGGKGQPVIIVSTIDNLIKGASGQALQNMNIMFGFEETRGLV